MTNRYQNDGYQRLADAIVLQAIRDYRNARNKLAREATNPCARHDVLALEKFFLSKQYTLFTGIDGAFLIRKVKGE